MLVNNDGNAIRRPKMTLGLLPIDTTQEQKTTAQKRRTNTNPSKIESRLQPADLHVYQLNSQKVRAKIDETLESFRENNFKAKMGRDSENRGRVKANSNLNER